MIREILLISAGVAHAIKVAGPSAGDFELQTMNRRFSDLENQNYSQEDGVGVRDAVITNGTPDSGAQSSISLETVPTNFLWDKTTRSSFFNNVGVSADGNLEDYIIQQKPNGQAIVLGEGSFGKVFLVCLAESHPYIQELERQLQQTNTTELNNQIRLLKSKQFALKEMKKMDAKHLEDAKREAKILKEVPHDNVIQYVASFTSLGVAGPVFYIVTEVADQGDLRQLIHNQKSNINGQQYTFSRKCIAKWVMEILSGLKCLQKQNIIHRDVKPANILAAAKPGCGQDVCVLDIQMKISDVGLARKMTVKEEYAQTRVGTKAYMAPEMWTRHYTNAVDIFSVGCILYELCKLKRMWENEREIFAYEQDPIYKPTISYLWVPDFHDWKDFHQICSNMVEADYKKRPSCDELLLEMQNVKAILDEKEEAPRPVPVEPKSEYENADYVIAELLLEEVMSELAAEVHSELRWKRTVQKVVEFVILLAGVGVLLCQWWLPSDPVTLSAVVMPIIERIDPCAGNVNISALDHDMLQCDQIGGDVFVTTEYAGDTFDCSDYLPKTEIIHGNLIISDAQNLKVVYCSGVTLIGGDIYVSQNPFLEELHFNNLDTVEGDIYAVGYQPQHKSSNDLATMEFPSLHDVGGDFWIEHTHLEKLLLPSLARLNSSFSIVECGRLRTIDAPFLEVVNDDLQIASNYFLPDLQFPSLNLINGTLVVVGNVNLRRADLPSLEKITGNLIVGPNDFRYQEKLQKLDLPELISVGGFVTIVRTKLEQVLFSQLVSIGDSLQISDNILLNEIYLPNLQDVGWLVSIANNRLLENIDFPDLLHIADYLDLSHNERLININLPEVKRIGNDVAITSNPELANINMENTKEIYGDLRLFGNGTIVYDDYPMQTFHSHRPGGGDPLPYPSPETGTNPKLEHLLLDKLQVLNGSAYISHTQLTEILLSDLDKVGLHVVILDNDNLQLVDMADCHAVGRNVLLAGNDELEAVIMSRLTFIDGSFNVGVQDGNFKPNPKLKQLDVGNLVHVAEDMNIWFTEVVTFMLQYLEFVGGHMTLLRNELMETIDLPEIIGVYGEVYIFNHPRLIRASMEKMKFITGSLSIDLKDFYGLTKFNVGIDHLPSVSGSFSIESLDLRGLNLIGGHLNIRSTKLEDIVLFHLGSIGDDVVIMSNPYLYSIFAPEVTSIDGGLFVFDHDKLLTINMSSLTTVANDVALGAQTPGYNQQVQHLLLESLVSIGGDFTLWDTGQLEEFVLQSLERVNGQFLVYGSISLPSDFRYVSDLKFLKKIVLPNVVAIHGHLLIYDFGSLEYVSMPKLSRVDGRLENCMSAAGLNSAIQTLDLPSLVSAHKVNLCSVAWTEIGLPSLQFINGDLMITVSTELQRISLPKVERVQGDVRVHSNPNLAVIDMPSTTRINSLILTFNPQLSVLNLDVLANVAGPFSLSENQVDTLSLPSLSSVGMDDVSSGFVAHRGLFIENAQSLRVVDLPFLEEVAGGLYFINTPVLGEVVLSNIETTCTNPTFFENCVASSICIGEDEITMSCPTFDNFAASFSDPGQEKSNLLCGTFQLPEVYDSYAHPNSVSNCKEYNANCSCVETYNMYKSKILESN